MTEYEVTAAGNVRVRIPIRFTRHGGRKKLLLPNEEETGCDNAVLLAFARAKRWSELLESGEFASSAKLAEAIGVNASYVARIVRLNQISPHIIKLFIGGVAPDGLSLTKLFAPFPESWREQHAMFGIVAPTPKKRNATERNLQSQHQSE